MFLMVCEFDDLRMWLQRLEKQSRGGDRLNEEVRMRKMELEARSMTNDGKAKMVVKLGVYGNDVKKLKNELAKLRSCSTIHAMVQIFQLSHEEGQNGTKTNTRMKEREKPRPNVRLWEPRWQSQGQSLANHAWRAFNGQDESGYEWMAVIKEERSVQRPRTFTSCLYKEPLITQSGSSRSSVV
ncbi:vesicle transport v-SNARE 11 [Tanacetum coccineum]